MEDVLDSSEISKSNRVTSFTDSDSEERFKESLMEEISDDDGNFIIAQPNYTKQQKVAAFRDFPDGCGPFTPMVVVPDNTLGETMDSEDAGVTIRAAESVKCKQNAAKAATRKRKNKNKKCFYYRRVSAVREFPPLCEENYSEVISEGVESLEKGLVEENVEDGDAYNNGRVMDMVGRE